MLFSSLVFICIFLPIVYIINRLLVNIKLQNTFLLLCSLFFYAWGETYYVLLMILTALINYLFALAMEKQPERKRAVLAATIICNLGMLGFFKYTDFVISIINSITGLGIKQPNIVLPIGISFFIFQAMSYSIDIYRKETAVQKNFAKLLLYISFFPQLIAGPIIKYHDINEQLDNRKATLNATAEGVKRFIIGLSKKLLLANSMGLVADKVFALPSTEMNIFVAWLGALSYIFQIYFDFSGYSDMAIGMGKMFGFTFKENFNYPYISGSIQEFWRRWHISLSTWFKEYLYIPLGGNRKGARRTSVNKVIVFFCTGLWHGASWTFVIWGLFHGAFIMLESSKIIKPDNWFKPFRHLYLLIVVIVGFVIFRADNMNIAAAMIKEMFLGFGFTHESMVVFAQFIKPSLIVTILICVIASTPAAKRIKLPQAAQYALSILLFALCMLNLSSSTFNPFIYFRF